MKSVLVATVALLFSALIWPPTVQADYWDGLDAYDAGDYQTALMEFRPLAEQGDALAQFELGWLYDNGYGVAQDKAKAAKWYRLAAEQGDPWAQNNLGWLYENGEGVPRDYTLAVKWYRLAALQGNTMAQENLAYMYRHGLGVARNETEAAKWERRGGEQDAAEASECIDVKATTRSPRLRNLCSYAVNVVVCCDGEGRLGGCRANNFETLHIAANDSVFIASCDGWIITSACKAPYRIHRAFWDPRVKSTYAGPCVGDTE